MRQILCALFLLASSAYLQGCISDSKGGSTVSDSDTSDVFPNGTRKPRMPRVAYRTHDSLVHLRILGTDSREESEYWVYRNDTLREQPLPGGWIFEGPDSGSYLYTLTDRLESAGAFRYHVRYGYREPQLSRPSPAFHYFYPGRSPSGSVSLQTGPDQRVLITLAHADSIPVSQAYFERRIGSDGSARALDTVVKSGNEPLRLLDTAFIHLDTMVHYRAVSMHAATETWLAPTPWDSIRVTNRAWGYVPGLSVRNLGNGIRAEILDAIDYSGEAWYVLYRNDSSTENGKAKVDSVPMRGAATLPLRDSVSQARDLYYWVEAADPYGRISHRSVPERVALTGIPRGPDIPSISVYPSFLKIFSARVVGAGAYVLYRSSSPGRDETMVDTLFTDDPVDGPTFVDIPPGDGRWSYRLVTLAGGKASTPGDWKQSEFFRYTPSYSLLHAPMINLGAAGVEATITPMDKARFHLIRSGHKDGSDSLVVDSLAPSDTRITLKDKPPLGTWYYRVVRLEKPSTFSNTIYRTALVEIDFTGKPVGPSIKTLTNYAAGIEVTFPNTPDAIAYVVERSPDTSKAWAVVDTLSVGTTGTPTFNDRPPKDGYWSYRARTLLSNLSLTDPGPATRTPTSWTYRAAYDNSLVASIGNRGPRVECPLTTHMSYGFFLKRSQVSDYSNPTTVDSIHAGAGRNTLEDVPPLGAYYYWVERMPDADQISGSLYRSAPFKVEFTGAPEVISLAKAARGVQIKYVTMALGDTLEVWRGSGSPVDTAAFALVARATAVLYSGGYEDITVDAGKSALYHYHLALRRDGKVTAKGPIKTLYYQP